MPRDIAYEPNEHGGRLVYYGATADADFWDERWAEKANYGRAREGHLPHYLRRAVRTIPAGGRVLEAGCGYGHFTVAMAARGFRAEGVDWAPQTVERLQKEFPAIPFMAGDVRALDVPDNSYDAVYSPGVCEHFVEGPDEVLHETARILRPNGLAIISAPTFNPLRQRLASAGRFPAARNGAFYQYAFSRVELEAAIRSAGMTPIGFYANSTMKTLRDHLSVPGPAGPLGKVVSVALDYAPVTRSWGHAGVWLASA
jgi:SAM-dependent methyltransferase